MAASPRPLARDSPIVAWHEVPGKQTNTLMQKEVWDGKFFFGAWTAGTVEVADVTDKAIGEVLAHVAVADVDDVNRACEAAAKAAPAWAATPAEERAAIVRRAGQLLIQHMDEAIYRLVRDSGSTKFKARSHSFVRSLQAVASGVRYSG